jgi:hypothetical protein
LAAILLASSRSNIRRDQPRLGRMVPGAASLMKDVNK